VNKRELVGSDEGAMPFVRTLVVALPVWLMLACAAPGGGTWRWLEAPALPTLFAAALAIWSCFGHSFVWPLVGTPLATLLWRTIAEALALSRLNAMEHLGDDFEIISNQTLGSLGPWLSGIVFASLVWLASTRRRGLADARDRNLHQAARWLLAVAVLACALAFANPSWLTLENLNDNGTYRSSVAWPDTKVITLLFALATAAISVAMIWRSNRRRLARRAFLDEIIGGKHATWRVAERDDRLPALLDPPGDGKRVLLEVIADESDGPYRGAEKLRAVARV
jgi:hypothetical protein